MYNNTFSVLRFLRCAAGLFGICILPFAASAQTTSSGPLERLLTATATPDSSLQSSMLTAQDLAAMSAHDYLNIEIPPLEVLIENARSNPAVRFYATRAEEEARGLKSERRTWMRYLKLNGTYQYGQFNDNTSYLDAEFPSYNRYSDKVSSYFNVGASLSVPIEELLNRRNRIKKQELRIQEAKLDEDRSHNEVALQIIDAYTLVVQNMAILRAKVEAMTLASAQYTVTETDFINGKVDAQTLSRQRNIKSTAILEYEQIRSTLTNALLRLEVISGTPILHKP